MSVARYPAIAPGRGASGDQEVEVVAVVDFLSQDVLIETSSSWFLMERDAAVSLARHILDTLGEVTE